MYAGARRPGPGDEFMTVEQLAHTKDGYSCWVRFRDSDVPILVGPHEDPQEICRIAKLIEVISVGQVRYLGTEFRERV